MTTPTLSFDASDSMYAIELTTPFPGLELDEWTLNPAWAEGSGRLHHIDNWRETDRLFCQALAWAANEAAHKIEYTSDSHVDDQYCLARFISQMTDVVYGYDQTLNTKEAIQAWLNDHDAMEDFIYIAMMLNGSSLAADPKLFSHFTFTDTEEMN
jgi:hypothetical protein